MQNSKQAYARTEFASAVNQVAKERDLDPQVIIDSIKQALVAAFKKDHPDAVKADFVYDAELDPSSGEARIFEQAGELVGEAEEAVVVVKKGVAKVDITPPGYGRIAAQTAKQVILQKVREAEKSNIVAEYEKRIGSLITGMVIRFVGHDLIIDAGKAEAVMPREDQVYAEEYRLNQRLTCIITGIRDSVRGREVVVSRADNSLIKELFKREVPEVSNGSVEIRVIARDPGSRTKIAVYSNQSGVDPVGSCVGQKGVRVQAVISELNGEKVDIIQFSEDPEKFITAALSPATGLTVKVNSKTQVAEVLAPPDQLSVAIGREGQNARLAGKLTGYHIDIKNTSPAEPSEAGTHEHQEDPSDTSQASSQNDQ